MQIPAYKIEDIKKAISEGTATPEQIETYATWKADMAAENARDEMINDAVITEIRAKTAMYREQTELARQRQRQLAQEAQARLEAAKKAAQDGE